MRSPHATLSLARLGDDRRERRSLRAEKAQLLHWRRLLRARLDLAVAGFAPPEPLGAVEWDRLPVVEDLPTTAQLASAIAVVTPIDPVELMNRLRTFDRLLATYGEQLDDALEVSTTRVVHDLATHARPHQAPTGTDGAR